MTYFIIEKIPNNYTIKKVDTAQAVINYLKPYINDEYAMKNITIIEGDEYEIHTGLKLKL